MKGPGEVTAISEALFDFMGQGTPIFDTEDTIMDSVCDLIDFDGDLDIPMEDIKVSPNAAFTRRRTFEGAFSLSDDCFIPSKKLKAEPVPMEVDSEPLFLPSYPAPQHTFTDATNSTHGGRRNYEDTFSPNDQVRREFAVSFRNLGLDLPVELGGPTRPVKKVIRQATRARAGGLYKYSRPDVVQGDIGSKSPREYLFLFAHFSPDGYLVN
jgi:hypothetical protein